MTRLFRWCFLATALALLAPACSGLDQKKGNKSWRVEKSKKSSKRKKSGKRQKSTQNDTAKHPEHDHPHRHPHPPSDHHHHPHPHPHLPGPNNSHHPW